MISILDRLLHRQTPIRGMESVPIPAIDLNVTPKGLPAVTAAQILDLYPSPIEELRTVLDLPMDLFESMVLPVIERLAERMHLLPASEGHHHSEAGGLFRHSLEVGVLSRRFSEDFLYGLEKAAAIREEVGTHWRLSLTLGGLLHDLGKVLTDLRVSDESETVFWSPYLEPLPLWAQRHTLDHYVVTWVSGRHGKHGGAAGVLMQEILGSSCIAFLTMHGPEPIEALYQTLIGSNSEEHFGALIAAADHQSVAQDLRGHPFSPGPSFGKRQEEILIQAMTDLILNKIWSTEGSNPLLKWHDDALFIDWYPAQVTLMRELKQHGGWSWPELPDSMADLLLERSHALSFVDREESTQRYWPLLLEGSEQTHRMIKLKTPSLIRFIPPIQGKNDEPGTAESHHPTDLDNEPPKPLSNAEFPETTRPQPAPSEAWLDDLPNSKKLREALNALMERGLEAGLRLIDDQLWIPYPEGLKVLGLPPLETVKLIQDAKLLQMDPKTGMRSVWPLEDELGCLFHRDATRAMASIWGPLETRVAPHTKDVSEETQPCPTSTENRAREAIRQSRKAAGTELFNPKRLRAVALLSDEKSSGL